VGTRLPGYLVFTVADDVGTMMVPCVIIMAMSIPGLCNLRLSATRRVVPCGRSAYSDLVRYVISVPVGRGVRGRLKCRSPRAS
jgi:hypothetical protein